MNLRCAWSSGICVALAIGAGGAAAQPASSASSGSSAYPERAIRIVVPQSAGSGGDIVARMLGDFLAKDLKQTIIVDNKAGANGIPAAVSVAKERPDGYTLMLAGVSQISFNQHLYKSTGYDPFKDFTFVAPVVDTPFVLVISKRSGFANFAAFAAQAKSTPGSLNFASAGAGNSTHLAMEMVAKRANIQLLHIPYKGSGPALLSVVSGETESMVSVLGTALPQINGGKVVPVAVLGAKRMPQLPQVPTLKELGVNAPAMPGWYALVAPARLDPTIAERLGASVQRFLKEPSVKSKLAELNLEPLTGSPADIRKQAEADSKVWGEFIKTNGIQAE